MNMGNSCETPFHPPTFDSRSEPTIKSSSIKCRPNHMLSRNKYRLLVSRLSCMYRGLLCGCSWEVLRGEYKDSAVQIHTQCIHDPAGSDAPPAGSVPLHRQVPTVPRYSGTVSAHGGRTCVITTSMAKYLCKRRTGKAAKWLGAGRTFPACQNACPPNRLSCQYCIMKPVACLDFSATCTCTYPNLSACSVSVKPMLVMGRLFGKICLVGMLQAHKHSPQVDMTVRLSKKRAVTFFYETHVTVLFSILVSCTSHNKYGYRRKFTTAVQSLSCMP